MGEKNFLGPDLGSQHYPRLHFLLVSPAGKKFRDQTPANDAAHQAASIGTGLVA